MANYRATVTLTWEFDAPDSLAEAKEKAEFLLSQLVKKPTPSHRGFQSQMSLLTLKHVQKPHLIRIRDYTPDEILSRLRDNDHRVPFVVNGVTYEVKMNSQRYHLFRKDRRCVVCGLEGTVMSLETMPDGTYPHFNLYGVQGGERVLFTKDHIRAKAVGGTDTLDNYQTMCAPCNQLKASYALSVESVRKLRALAQNPKGWTRKELNRRIQETRLLLVDCLDGQ